MARNKKGGVPHYEVLFIVSNKYTENELTPIVEGVEATIKENGGEVTHKENWGKKKFAYTINHFNHGYYTLVEFDVEAKNVAQIEKTMRMNADVLRHTIVALAKRTPEQIVQDRADALARIEENKAERRGTQEVVKPKKVEETKVKEAAPKKAEVKEEKVDTKELDQKLDKILETDDLL